MSGSWKRLFGRGGDKRDLPPTKPKREEAPSGPVTAPPPSLPHVKPIDMSERVAPAIVKEVSSPMSTSFVAGQMIGGHYEVLRPIGKGGMGVVYRVRKPGDGTIVALKTLQDRFMVTDPVYEAFKREANVWVDLGSHPFIVSARFVREVSGRLYVEMDLIEPDSYGRVTLEEHLGGENALMEPKQVLSWAIMFCIGMEHACRHGLVAHGDIKPSNVLISGGVLKISDFGLAVAHRPRVIEGGTEGYLAPERQAGQPADLRSDIYAFGVLLWQMATGSPQPPKMTAPEFSVDTFAELEPVVRRCVAADPAARYQSFASLGQALMSLTDAPTELQFSAIEAFRDVSGFPSEGRQQTDLGLLVDKSGSLVSLGRFDEALDYCARALAIDPDEPTAMSNKGLALSNLGRNDEAIECLRRATYIAPWHAGAWGNMGWVLYSLDRYEQAIACYDRSLHFGPRNPNVFNNKGLALAGLGRNTEAIGCFDMALEIDGWFARALANKAGVLVSLRRPQEAVQLCRQALQIDPHFSNAAGVAGKAYEAMGELDEALRHYEKALSLDSENPDAAAMRPHLLAKMGRWELATEALAEVLENPRLDGFLRNLGLQHRQAIADLLYNRGIDSSSRGEFEVAIKCYERAVIAVPNHAKALTNLGVLTHDKGRYVEAIGYFDRALDANPQLAHPWYNKGLALRCLGYLPQAMECYLRAVKIDPQHAQALTNIGNILIEQLRYAEALNYFERAIAANPSLPEALSGKTIVHQALNGAPEAQQSSAQGGSGPSGGAGYLINLAQTLADKGQLAEAVDCLDRAISAYPGIADAWFGKGTLLHALQRNAEARRCYERAVAINPKHAEALTNMGIMLFEEGRVDDAIELYNQAISADSSLANAWFNLGGAMFAERVYARAQECFLRTVELDPSHAKALNLLGVLFYSAGEVQSALDYFERALSADPSYKKARENREMALRKMGKR